MEDEDNKHAGWLEEEEERKKEEKKKDNIILSNLITTISIKTPNGSTISPHLEVWKKTNEIRECKGPCMI